MEIPILARSGNNIDTIPERTFYMQIGWPDPPGVWYECKRLESVGNQGGGDAETKLPHLGS